MTERSLKSSSLFPKVGSDLYRCFLKHLVQIPSPARTLSKTAYSKSSVEKAESVMMKAFSNELTKLGFGEQFLWPIMKEFGIQLGMEGLGRLAGTSHRSGAGVLKDTMSNALFHFPMAAAGKALETAPNGTLKSVANWFHNKASWDDPMSFSAAGRAAKEGIGLGMNMLAKSMTPEKKERPQGAQPTNGGLGTPRPLSGNPKDVPYEQLRLMDPRIVSQYYA